MPATSRPIVNLLELLGRKWSLRIIWELRDAPLPYRQLQRACDDVSPTMLARRLREIEGAGLVVNGDGGYGLTPLGRDIGQHLLALSALAERLEHTATG